MYKLTPLYPFDYSTYNELMSPDKVFKLREGESQSKVKVVVPGYDYIPPEQVSLYVTNMGGQTPSYIYRLFIENYSKEDLYED